MKESTKKSLWLVVTVIMCCVAMAIVDAVIEPAYIIKCILKIGFFFLLPLALMKLQKEKVFADSFVLNKKSALNLLGLGLVIYVVIMAAFLVTRGFFDYSSLVNSLSSDQNVSRESFIWVALYISFCNSLLEEFLFRFVAFIKLGQYTSKKASYIFSSLMFAVYHIAMLGSSFPLPLLVLALAGLAVGGLIFNYVDSRNGNIYNSWIIHTFADFAIMTVWFIHI